MAEKGNEQQFETEIFQRAVENVFRKLIRFLVGRISLTKLQDMIRHIYVDEAILAQKLERPGKAVSLTSLAVVTGLDTRTLKQVKKEIKQESHKYQDQHLEELTPESAVIEAWLERVKTSRIPEDSKVLTFGEDNSEFENLVRSTVSTRGVTPRSIIQRLVDANSIEVDDKKRVLKLVVNQYSPYISRNESNMVISAFSAISNLISTIEHNVSSEAEDRFFQRQWWTFRLDPVDLIGFREATKEMLERYESMAWREMAPWEKKNYGRNKLTAGVGFYYFEDTKGGN